MKTFFNYLWYDKHVPNIYNRIRFPVRIQIENELPDGNFFLVKI